MLYWKHSLSYSKHTVICSLLALFLQFSSYSKDLQLCATADSLQETRYCFAFSSFLVDVFFFFLTNATSSVGQSIGICELSKRETLKISKRGNESSAWTKVSEKITHGGRRTTFLLAFFFWRPLPFSYIYFTLCTVSTLESSSVMDYVFLSSNVCPKVQLPAHNCQD